MRAEVMMPESQQYHHTSQKNSQQKPYFPFNALEDSVVLILRGNYQKPRIKQRNHFLMLIVHLQKALTMKKSKHTV